MSFNREKSEEKKDALNPFLRLVSRFLGGLRGFPIQPSEVKSSKLSQREVENLVKKAKEHAFLANSYNYTMNRISQNIFISEFLALPPKFKKLLFLEIRSLNNLEVDSETINFVFDLQINTKAMITHIFEESVTDQVKAHQALSSNYQHVASKFEKSLDLPPAI